MSLSNLFNKNTSLGIKDFFENTAFLFWSLLVFKILLASLFSSDYQNKLFIPFINHYLYKFDNPWQYFYENPTGAEFPYSPVMMYILSFFYAPIYFLKINSTPIINLFFKV